MTIKNYKELCEVLGVDKKTGGAKQRQLEWFMKYFTYKKEGQKFIITSISNKEVQPMEDKRGGAYNKVEFSQNIEKLILDILVQSRNNGKIFLSKNKLFHALEMVNINYLDCHQRVSQLSKYIDVREENVQEWFDTTGGVLERSLDSALKNLAKQSLIFWSREITICVVEPIPDSECLIPITRTDKNGKTIEDYKIETLTKKVIREAWDSEKKFILKTEREVMLSLDCEDKQEIIRKGLWNDFERKVKAIIKREYNILYYYQSYKILSNPEHIREKWNQVNFLLNNSERRNAKSNLNTSIMNRLSNNAISRQKKLSKELANSDYDSYIDPRIIRRREERYIPDNEKLNKTLIDKNAKDIRKEVRKIKADNNKI